jgi:hypothetical protein
MARAAADFAAIDLLKILSTPLPGGRIGRMVEIDLMGPTATTRDLLKVPRCLVCADMAAREEASVEAQPTEAATPADTPAQQGEPSKEAKTDPLPVTATESAA